MENDFSPEQIKKYIDTNGIRCPTCDSDDLHADNMEVGEYQAWRNVKCQACGEELVEVFKMVDVEKPTP